MLFQEIELKTFFKNELFSSKLIFSRMKMEVDYKALMIGDH